MARPGSWLRRLGRTLLRLGLGLVGLALLYGLLALVLPRIPVNAGLPPLEPRAAAGSGTGLVRVFVESNGVHTGFVLPVRDETIDWRQHLPTAWFAPADDSFEFVSFGWGDKGFYLETPTWADLEFSTAFKAVFFLSSSAMHVTYLRRAPATSASCRPLELSPEQYRTLSRYVLESFERDGEGRLILIDAPGYTAHDRFFEARGTYSFLHTCNTWTGEGLARTGVETGLWTPFEWDVMRPLRD